MNRPGYVARQALYGQYNVNMNYRFILKKTYIATIIASDLWRKYFIEWKNWVDNSVLVEIRLPHVLIKDWNEMTENQYFKRNVLTDK